MEQRTYAEWLRYIAGEPLGAYAHHTINYPEAVFLCNFINHLEDKAERGEAPAPPRQYVARLRRRIDTVIDRAWRKGGRVVSLNIPATLSSKRAWLLSEADRADRYTNSRKGKACLMY